MPQQINNKNKNGFTMIELLIIILIIGILAAIALPQYQLAIAKSKFSELVSSAKTLADAYQRYYFLTGDFPNDIKLLDISFSSAHTTTKPNLYRSCIIFQNYYCCITQASKDSYYGDAMCGMPDYSFGYTHRIFSDTGVESNYKDCRAKADNNIANRVCKSTKYRIIYTDSTFATPYGAASSYNAYISQ